MKSATTKTVFLITTTLLSSSPPSSHFCQAAVGTLRRRRTQRRQMQDRGTRCPAIYNPICCHRVVDYANECIAAHHGVDVDSSCTLGPCPYEPCHTDYNNNNTTTTQTICCKGITEFDNECEAQAAGMNVSNDCKVGSCAPPCPEDDDDNPVCCHGQNFTNQCWATRTRKYLPRECQRGTCPTAPVRCPALDDPVCCDGTDYVNPCVAARAGYSSWQCDAGQCPCSPDFLDPVCCQKWEFPNACIARQQGQEDCIAGPCPSIVCTAVYDPVCCTTTSHTNEQEQPQQDEYTNLCEALRAGLDGTTCIGGTCSNDNTDP